MSSKKTTPADVIIGNKIRLARLATGMSQETLAAHLRITFQQVQKYERGVNRISASRLKEAASILGQPITWFYDDEPASGGVSFGDLDPKIIAKLATVKDPSTLRKLGRMIDVLREE